MIGNRSSYDKKKKYVDEIRNTIMKVKNKILRIEKHEMTYKTENHENEKNMFAKKVPQENSVIFSLLNIMK